MSGIETDELQRHEDTHRNRRQHACQVCQRTFGRQDALKRHLKTHELRERQTTCHSEAILSPEIYDTRSDPYTTSVAFDPDFDASAVADSTDALVLHSSSQLDNAEVPAANSIIFPADHAWPEATDLLEILMNVDAGWPMDAQVPLTDSNPGTFCESNQVQLAEGSFARARQAMRHMSNLMQDLVR